MPIASAQIESYPTPDEVRNGLLTAVAYSYRSVGIAVNVAEGSELWFRFGALAQFVSVAIANGRVRLKALNPLEAEGDDLVAWADVFGVVLRPAVAAIGYVRVETIRLGAGYATGSIPSGWRAIGPTGIEYETVAAAVVTHGSLVEVRAVSTGTIGNTGANTVLAWEDASLSFLKPDVVVAAGGIADGSAGDTLEDLRRNLLRRLRDPAGGGNPAQVQQTALNASAAIGAVYTYPGAQGPASDEVALVSDVGDRTVTTNTIALAAVKLTGEMPGSIRYNVTTVNPEPADVVINIAAPLPQAAGGAGGGFRDALPWPSSAESGVKGLITAKSSGGFGVNGPNITVDSTSADPPKVGDRFGVWDPTFVNSGKDADGVDLTGLYGKMQEFTIQAVSGSSGAYVLKLDVTSSSAIDFIVAGESRVSVACEKLVTYGKAFMLAMYALGPGEKTDNEDILPFGVRNPDAGVAGEPIGLSNLLLRRISDTNKEVSDLDFAARYAADTTTTLTSPSLPASTASPPRILTLKNLAFRRLVS